MGKEIDKRPIVPGRVRQIGEGFSWIDRRFVRDGLIAPLSRDEIALYFFLIAVADRHGMSFYDAGSRTPTQSRRGGWGTDRPDRSRAPTLCRGTSMDKELHGCPGESH